MRLLVCGGRDYADAPRLFAALDTLHSRRPVSVLIEGGARGADALAKQWAADAGVEVRTFAADWKAHGKAAGPMRNQRMLTEGMPDAVAAFPGGTGTQDMIRRAEAAGLKVWKPYG